MADDILQRLVPFVHDEQRMPAGLIRDVMDEIERLRAELDECHALHERMADILNRTANALHGGPLENGLWSWNDLPLLAQEACRD